MGNALNFRHSDSHFLDLWAAVQNYDDESLYELLKNRRSDRIRQSVRACLLHSSIIRANVGAVRLILESGFDLSKAAKNGFFPLATAAEYAIFERSGQHTNFAVTRSASLNTTPEKSVCYETMRLLFDHGARMTYRNEQSKSNPLRFLHRLAVVAPDAADLLFSEMTPFEMNSPCSDPGVTPLTACFLYVCFYYKHGEIADMANLSAVFSSAILPLLRYGADIGPELLEARSPYSLYPFSNRICIAVAELNQSCSVALWGRPNVIADLLIAVFQSGEFYPSLINHLMKDIALMSKGNVIEQAVCVRQFVQYIKAQFPLSLQQLCRIAILRTMPLGRRRVEALRRLGLPKPVVDFLLFKEFEPPFTLGIR